MADRPVVISSYIEQMLVRRWSVWIWLARIWKRWQRRMSLAIAPRSIHRSALLARATFLDLPLSQVRSHSRRFAMPRMPWRVLHHFVVVGLLGLALWMSPFTEEPDAAPSINEGVSIVRDLTFVRTPLTSLPVDQSVSISPVGDSQVLQQALRDTYRLAQGETLGEVAARYGVSTASLFWSNDLDQYERLVAGLELRIPRQDGVLHTVREGETLESIAASYGVTPAALVLFPANHLQNDTELMVNRVIFVPGGRRAYPEEVLARYGSEAGIFSTPAVLAVSVRENETNLRSGPGVVYPRLGYITISQSLKLVGRFEDWVKLETIDGLVGWIRSDLLTISDETLVGLPVNTDYPPPPPIWVWPTRGVLTSSFGWRSQPFRSFHDGIDFANVAGTKIYAARAGTVIEAGWCSGFGYCVKIDHGSGIQTIYGHMLKRPVVSRGEQVEAGQLIGLMGSTYDRAGGGYSTGVHLHFTVKVNGQAVNPLQFLP